MCKNRVVSKTMETVKNVEDLMIIFLTMTMELKMRNFNI